MQDLFEILFRKIFE